MGQLAFFVVISVDSFEVFLKNREKLAGSLFE
jgi:hypothetical protein